LPAALPGKTALEQMALDHRPELKAIDSEIRQLQTRVRLTEKNYKPDVSVGAGYMIMPSGSMNRNGYMAELSFNLPCLNRAKDDSDIQESQSQVRVQRAELETQKAMVFQEIQEAVIRANTA